MTTMRAPFLDRPVDATRRSERLIWVDALKTAGMLGVIGIHVTADSSGLPYAAHEASARLLPGVARALATSLNYPVFLIASFFLLALGLERGDASPRYIPAIRVRLRRLVPPFLLWSLVFLVVRHAKATAFGYEPYYLQELAQPVSWLRYVFLGGAQYHLHFMPLLIALTLLYPVYRAAFRRPCLAAALVPMLWVWTLADARVYAALEGHAALPFALTGTKVAAYTGYGLVGFALAGVYRHGASRNVRVALAASSTLVAVLGLAVLIVHGIETADAGRWLPRGLATHFAYYLTPPAMVVLFLCAPRLSRGSIFSRLGPLTFGVYLFHPVLLDGLEIMERGWGLAPATTVAFNFAAVSILSFLMVSLASRTHVLRLAFGLPERVRA